MDKINLAEKFSQIHEYWKPYIAGELNGQLVKLDKLKGEFVWHHHENEDEMFLVVKGGYGSNSATKQYRWKRASSSWSHAESSINSSPTKSAFDRPLRTCLNSQHRQRRERVHAARVGKSLAVIPNRFSDESLP